MKKKSLVKSIIYNIFTFGFAIVMVYPIIWIILSSFKESTLILRRPMQLLPDIWHFSNYIDGWNGFGGGKSTFRTFFSNSFIISGTSTIGAVISSVLVAYGFSRINFKGRKFWFICMMITLMLPVQVIMLPQYIQFNYFGLVGTKIPLILPHFFGQGFFIFLTMQFMTTIPSELDEAARIDGCGKYGIFYMVILPLIKPAIITTTIFSFYWRWDDFFGSLLYLDQPKDYTAVLALKLFADPESLGMWGPMFAMGTLSLLPVLIVFLFFQKYLVQGISTTGLKA